MYENRNVHAIVCIRMGSSRLHGKAMLNLGGKRVVDILHHRISKSKYVDKIIFAMPDAIEDEYLVEYCNSQGYDTFVGEKDDVLTRYYEACLEYSSDIIVDVTGDCPMVDWNIIDAMVHEYVIGSDDRSISICSNVIDRTFPRGLDVQVFGDDYIGAMDVMADNPIDRQHVTSAGYLNPKHRGMFRHIFYFGNDADDYSEYRLTLDTHCDYELLALLFEVLPTDFTYADIKLQIEKCPEMFKINNHIQQKNYYKELAKAYADKQYEL